MMESCSDIDKWNPMLDDFNDREFNSHFLSAVCPEGPSSGLVRLLVAGIPSCLTEQGLRNLMAPVANILHVSLVTQRNIGFISVHRKDAVRVIAHFNGYKLDDNCLTVKIAGPKTQTSGSGTVTSKDCASAKEEEIKSSSGTKTVEELKVPTLGYPSAAKYVEVGQELVIKVLGVVSPSQFWICRHCPEADVKLKELHTEMQKHYSSLPPKSGFKPNGSGLYATQKRDSGNWCRVQVLNFDSESASVLLLDYGTCERVRFTYLHSLEGQFCSLPFQAICCSLAHVQGTPQWSQEAVSCMCQLLSDDQLRAIVCDIDGYNLSVELIMPSGQSVSDILVRRNCARYADGFEPRLVQKTARSDFTQSSKYTTACYPTVKDLNFMPLTVNEHYDMVVLHARSASDVTVCMKKNIGELTAMLMELSSYQACDSYVPHAGEIVVAQYAADASWYRAEILSFGCDNAVVRFVDFGNIAEVSLKSLIQLQPCHVAFPVYSVNVAFRSSDINSELLSEYSNVNLKVVEKRGNRYVVVLAEDDSETKLAENPSSQQTYSLSDIAQCCLDAGKTYKAWVTDSTDVEKFYMQASDMYQPIDEELHAIYSSKSGGYEPQQIGELIAVHLDVDDAWYRGVVKEIENQKAVKCQLIDFGISVTRTSKDISQFDPQLLTHPTGAVKCSFSGVSASSVGSWKDDYLMPLSSVYDMTVIEVKDDLHIVELVHVESKTNWKQKLIDDGFLVETKLSPKSTPISTNRTVPPLLSSTLENALIQPNDTVTVTWIQSPGNLFVQQQQQVSSKVLEALNSHCRAHGEVYRPREVGEVVAVMHHNHWYRAEVLSLCTHSASMFFIDYGTTADVEFENVRVLPAHFATALPKLAVHCALGGLSGTCSDGSYSAAACRWFRDNYLQVTCTVTKVKLSDSPNTLLINLKRPGSDKTARMLLLDYGMAVTSTGSVLHSASGGSQPQSDNIPQVASKLAVAMSKERTYYEDAPTLQMDDVVWVVYVVSPEDFYVVPRDAVQKMKPFLEELDHYCNTANTLQYSPQYVGEPVAAKFDGEWYRAEVMKLMLGDSFEVFFVDFGNTAVVSAGDIRTLPGQFVKWPKQAVHCGIDGISGTGSGGSFTSVAVEWFKGKVGCGLRVTLSSVSVAGRKHMVDMNVGEGHSAKKLLVAAGFATKSF